MDAAPPPLAYQTSVATADFRPRTARLITAGILLLLAASVFAVLSVLAPMASSQAMRGPNQWQHYLVGGAGYLLAAAIFFCLGVGALLGRRWARPLILILSTHWLIVGVFTTLGVLAFVPAMADLLGNNAAVPGVVVMGFLIGIVVFLLITMVAWPGVLLLMMRHDDVRRTCEWRNPGPCWTDNRPLKIIGLELTLIAAAMLFSLSSLQPVVPFFGLMLEGPSKYALAAAAAVGSLIAAYEVHRLRPAGWWLGLLTTIIPLLAYVPSAWTMPISTYYRTIGTDPKSAEVFIEHPEITRLTLIGFPLAFVLGFTLYMLGLRKVFFTAVREKLAANKRG